MKPARAAGRRSVRRAIGRGRARPEIRPGGKIGSIEME